MPLAWSTLVASFITALVIFSTLDQSDAVNCTMDATVYTTTFTTRIGWIIGNTSQSEDPIELQCSSLEDITSYFLPFEGDFCYYAGKRVLNSISGCDANSDGNLCYAELPLTPSCECMGTMMQNWCASVMFENRASNNTRR